MTLLTRNGFIRHRIGAWGRKCRTHPPSVVLGVTFVPSELRGCVLETTMLPATEI